MAFTGKVALVTGGASGMGRLAALKLANQGATVAIVDMNEDNLVKVAAEHDNIHPYRCDVTDLDAVQNLLAQVKTEHGDIDRLTHCAAIMPSAPLLDQPIDLINRMMRINYEGTVNMVKSVLPDMRARNQGQIVIFGSIAGSVLAPEIGAYCATKAATNAFAEVLIRENRDSDVHIMLVCPPMVNTPLIEQAASTKNIRESRDKGRLADPEFIVNEVEKGLDKKQEILLPGAEAKILVWLRRHFPGLLWRVIDASAK